MRLNQIVLKSLFAIFIIFAAGQLGAAVNATDEGTPTVLPTPTQHHHKKTSTAAVKSQPQPMSTQVVKEASEENKVLPKAKAVPTPSPDPELYNAAQAAFSDEKFSEALRLYQEYEKENGATPALEQKIDLAKYYAGEDLKEEAREGFRMLKRKKHLNYTAHNIMVYGKEEPTRSCHPFTLSFCLLTPDLLGVDFGYTLKAHWNFGCGYGPLLNTYNPRLKYYFKGDISSFFLGVGYAKYSLHVSTSTNGDSEIFGQKVNGDASGGLDGRFTYLSFGPSLQAGGGCFMEFEMDLGVAKFHGAGKASGHSTDSNGNNSTDDSKDGKFDYDGPMGMIGVRIGLAF
jgi:hypothetical protein